MATVSELRAQFDGCQASSGAALQMYVDIRTQAARLMETDSGADMVAALDGTLEALATVMDSGSDAEQTIEAVNLVADCGANTIAVHAS